MEQEIRTFNKKKFWIGFIVTFLVTLAISGITFGLGVLYRVGTNESWDYEIYVNLIDSFTVGGGAGIVIYLLGLLTTAGAFDIFGYSVKLVWYNTFHRNVRETALPKTYAEYKMIKRGRKPDSTLYILLGSSITFIIAIILMAIYYSNF